MFAMDENKLEMKNRQKELIVAGLYFRGLI